MKSVKKILALLLAAVMTVSLLAACGGEPDNDPADNPSGPAPSVSSGNEEGRTIPEKQYVIGIAEAQANDEVTTRRAYLENYIAPN